MGISPPGAWVRCGWLRRPGGRGPLTERREFEVECSGTRHRVQVTVDRLGRSRWVLGDHDPSVEAVVVALGGNRYRRTGVTHADGFNLGNPFPFIYQRLGPDGAATSKPAGSPSSPPTTGKR